MQWQRELEKRVRREVSRPRVPREPLCGGRRGARGWADPLCQASQPEPQRYSLPLDQNGNTNEPRACAGPQGPHSLLSWG